MAVDAIEELRAAVESNWVKGNTDSRLPSLKKIYDQKRVSMRYEAGLGQGAIFFYETTSPKRLAGVGASTYFHEPTITCDIRVINNESRSLKFRDELFRILHSLRATGTTSFAKLIPDFNDVNMSNRSTNLFRYVIEVRLRTHRRSY